MKFNIKRRKMIPYEVRIYCECDGEAKATGQVLTSSPPQYPTVCESCGARCNLLTKYPVIEYDEE